MAINSDDDDDEVPQSVSGHRPKPARREISYG